ncbi:Zinc finger BED domain-containing protein 1 [Thelohanellus kitauei]|uniref:Zinc finger BED domain-containing protein 1 n=1 Tax=Thelohanellus kitauei TaxID=669202 RepID=A0A0C2MDQ3_THEKT|nr:Zinc finger BED domain-containing protein 1 [Thelohanellus kitauei]
MVNFLTSSFEPPSKRRRFCYLLNSDVDSGSTHSNENLILCRYRSEPRIEDNECQLRWWKEHECSYPALVIIARKYVCTPATSVLRERLFSFSGNIITKKTASLTSDNVNKLLWLNN